MSDPGSVLAPSPGPEDGEEAALDEFFAEGGPDSVVTKKVPKSKIICWASWDWGSAAFNAVATSFVFSVYLTSGLFADQALSNQYLAWGMTGAGVVIALLAPITGQRADRSGSGVKLLGWFSLLVFLCLAAMFFVAPGSSLGPIGALWLGIALLGVGNIFFEFGSVNYNAMLNDLSTDKNRGTISGFGWGSGYVGGIVLLLILLVGFILPDVGWFGVTSANGLDVRVAMLFAALWWGVFALPVLINPPDREPVAHDGTRETLADSYKHLWHTVKSLWKEAPHTLRFLLASAIFRDGLAGVFTFGGVIAGSVFGFSSTMVIVFAIVANVVAGIATMSFGPLDDKWGSKNIMMISLVLMIIAGMAIFFFWKAGAIIFWIFGLGLTIFVGPVQSASRTYLANMIPPGREGEVFGLYATTGRAVSFMAPALYALAISIGGKVSAEADPTHWGIVGIVVVIAIGLILLIPVKPEHSRMVDATKKD